MHTMTSITNIYAFILVGLAMVIVGPTEATSLRTGHNALMHPFGDEKNMELEGRSFVEKEISVMKTFVQRLLPSLTHASEESQASSLRRRHAEEITYDDVPPVPAPLGLPQGKQQWPECVTGSLACGTCQLLILLQNTFVSDVRVVAPDSLGTYNEYKSDRVIIACNEATSTVLSTPHVG